MKHFNRALVVAAIASASLASLSTARAADVTWDTAPGTVGAGDSAITGGAGTWDITNGNWTVDAGVNNVAWNNANGDLALFDDTGGTVTLGPEADITLQGMKFIVAGYTVDGAGNTFTLAGNGDDRIGDSPGPSLSLDASGTATVAANIRNDGNLLTIVGDRSGGRNIVVSGVISGSGGLSTFESVTATLSGANTYTGQTKVNAATTSGSTLIVSSLNSVTTPPQMVSSSLGVPADAAAGTIEIGNTGKQASSRLVYTGSGETTDRVIAFKGNGNNQTQRIEHNGAGLLRFTSPPTYAGGTNCSVGLTGTGNGQFDFGIPSGPVNLRKEGTGTWTVGGASAPGNTIVSAGTLNITGTLGGESTSVTGGTLSLGDGTNNASLSDSSTLSVSGGGVIDLNYSSGSPDSVFVLIINGTAVAPGNYGNTASGADNGGAGVGFYDAVFTGTGIITTAGGLLPAGEFLWDGGDVNIGADGNAASAGGGGTWDTSIQNWDVGYTAHAAWGNTTGDTAIFGGTSNGGTVVLGADMSIENLEIELPNGNGTPYTIGDVAEDNTLTFGGGKTISVTATGNGSRHRHIIRAGIAGAPDMSIIGPNSNGVDSFQLLPPSGVTMTLGSVNMLNNLGSNKRLILGGESSGNVASAVTWTPTANQLMLTKASTGDWTITNNLNIDDGRLYVEDGTLTISGTDNFFSHRVGVNTVRESNFTNSGGSAKLIARGDFTINDTREDFVVQGGGTIAPGASVGTLSVDWNTTGGSTGEFIMQNGSIYEWEVGAASTDVIDIKEVAGQANLNIGDITIKVVDAGGTPDAVDQLPVFTYDAGVTRSIGTVTIDISGTSYTGSPTLVDDTAGTIYITGLSGAAANPFDDWAATGSMGAVTFEGDTNGDGIQDGIAFLLGVANPDDDANGALPDVSEDGSGGLVLTFECLPSGDRGTAELRIEHSSDLGGSDPWQATSAQVPDATNAVPDNGVTYVVTPGSPTNDVAATIGASEAAGGKLFGRLTATE